jgi:hypothetical protein|tara:strand:- start:2038 stop:2196 length:159 start_codon:yes stop_codon:yes gene_type:complete
MRVKVRKGKGGGTIETLGGRKIKDGDTFDIPEALAEELSALVAPVAEKKSKE